MSETRIAMKKMTINKKILFYLIMYSMVGVIYLSVEGAYAISHRGQPAVSILYNIYTRLGLRRFRGNAQPVTVFRLDGYIDDVSQIEDLLPEFKKSGVIINNSPFKKLVTDEARATYQDAKLGINMKPKIEVESAIFHARVFKKMDPVLYSRRIDKAGKPLTAKARSFIEKYSFVKTTLSTDSLGNRTTLPHVDSRNIALVVGDSVAFGVGLNDSETMASQMQRRQKNIRFVNLGVPGANAKGNLLRLKDRIKKYGKNICAVVYVHCDNDITSSDTPNHIVTELTKILDKNGIGQRVFIAGQRMGATMPGIIRGGKAFDINVPLNINEKIIALAKANGFFTINFANLLKEFDKEAGSIFAGMSLYVDHIHFSRLGTKEIVKQMPLFHPLKSKTADE